jgi:ABC-type molybdate transport system ATPase subunit
MTISVLFDNVFLHDPATPFSFVTLDALSVSEKDEPQGEVRIYANNVRVAINRAARSNVVTVTLLNVTLSQLRELRTRAGKVQLYRDSRGRCWWGRIGPLDIAEERVTAGGVLAAFKSVSFDIDQVSHTEVV